MPVGWDRGQNHRRLLLELRASKSAARFYVNYESDLGENIGGNVESSTGYSTSEHDQTH